MNPELAKTLRSVQVYFPVLQDLRFMCQRNIRKILNKTHEDDFEILSLLPKSENKLFVDIGANRGDAIQSILMRRPDASVMAFEPNIYLIEKLEKLYKGNSHVKIYNYGLGSEASSFPLYIPFYNNYMFDGLSSFKEKNASDWLTTRLYGFKKEKLEVKKITCTVKCLDEFSVKPFFIKIDVQGFEYEVLLGAKKTLEDSRPIILVETPNNKELTFLSQLGYQPFLYQSNKLISGSNNYSNVFFIHEEILPSIKKNLEVVQERILSHEMQPNTLS